MGETKYVLVDSSGSPLMRGDKVLLDKKCCEDDQVSMCVYYLRSECQGDGTFGHVFLHRTECVTMPEKDVPGWTDALKPGIWRSAGRNVIEVPLAESKECEKCVVETDEDMNRLLALAPEIPKGLSCECDNVKLKGLQVPYHELVVRTLSVYTYSVSEDGQVELLSEKRFPITEYDKAVAELQSEPAERTAKLLDFGPEFHICERLDLTLNYLQFPPGDAQRKDADKAYEKWFKGTLSGTMPSTGSEYDALEFSIDIYAKRLYNYSDYDKREIQQLMEIVGVSNPDETTLSPLAKKFVFLVPTFRGTSSSDTTQYKVIWCGGYSEEQPSSPFYTLGLVDMQPVDTKSTTFVDGVFGVDGSTRFVSTSGALYDHEVPDTHAGMSMAYWTPGEENKATLHCRVWRMPAITEDSLPPYDEYTWDKAPSDALENPTKIPLFFGFKYEVGVTTDEKTAYQESVKEQYERIANSGQEDGKPGQMPVPLVLQECLERKYLYTTVWRDPDCSGDIAPGGYPFGTGLDGPDTKGHYGYRQVIDNVDGQANFCTSDQHEYDLGHEDEDTSYDEGGSLLPIPGFRCYDENTDGHAYSRRELTYANFPQWCMDGCPSGVTMHDLAAGAVPKPPTLLSDILISLSTSIGPSSPICSDPYPSYGWPNSFLFLCQKGLTTAKGQDRAVERFSSRRFFFPWTSGKYKLEGGNDEPRILFSRKLELHEDTSLTTTKLVSEPVPLTELVEEINGLLTEDDLGKAVYVCALSPTTEQHVRDILNPDTGEVDSTWEVKPSGFKALYASNALKFPISAVGTPVISPDKKHTGNIGTTGSDYTPDPYNRPEIDWTTVDEADAIYVKSRPDTETETPGGHICRNIHRSTMLVAFTFPYLQCRPDATVSANRYEALSVLGHALGIESLTAQRTNGIPLANRWKRVSVDVSGSISLTSSDSYSIAEGPSSQRQVTAGASTFNYLFNITDGHSEYTNWTPGSYSCPALSSARITASQSYTTNYDDEDGSISGTATANGVTSIPISLRLAYVLEDYEKLPVLYVPGLSYSSLRREADQNWSGVVKTGIYYKDWDHPTMPNIQGLTPSGPGKEHATCEYGDPYSVGPNYWDCGISYKIDNAKQVNSAGGIRVPGITISGAWPEITISQKMKLVSTWHDGGTGWYTDGKATEIWNVEIKIRDLDAS